jgi:hypothetical protein
MSHRDFQALLLKTSGSFSRSRLEWWAIRAQSVFLFLVSCYVLGLTYRYFQRNPDPFLQVFLVIVVVAMFSISFALYRHGIGCYSILNGEVRFERPKGTVRWRENIADISDLSGSPSWFWENWVVVHFGDRKRRIELLPSLLGAMNNAVPSNTSFERTREG